ncbi:hypothetical protein Lser_V15G10021 [Lactuca serriola]
MSLTVHLLPRQASSMAESSYVQDTFAHANLLTIKPQQNLIIDLTPFVYEPYMLYVVECLKYSPLVVALTKVEVLPMTCLSHIYSTAFYDQVAKRIHFEIHNEKTSISKNRFCALIGLAHEPTLVNLDSITTGQLFSMFYQMGYTETLTTVTKFKKSCLPPQWNGLFTLLYKGLSECSAGSDGASKSFMTVLYGLYNGVTLDCGEVIWQQLVQSLSSSSRHSEISCARYWSIITKWAMDHLHVPIMLNPHDWVLLNNILLSNPQEYQPIIDHIKRMLVCYIHEVANMDQEIASAIHKRTTIKPMGRAGNINSMIKGKINTKYHTVMFLRGEGQKCLFALIDKHLFSTACLEHILEIIQRCNQNSAADKKLFTDMLRWYIQFR